MFHFEITVRDPVIMAKLDAMKELLEEVPRQLLREVPEVRNVVKELAGWCIFHHVVVPLLALASLPATYQRLVPAIKQLRHIDMVFCERLQDLDFSFEIGEGTLVCSCVSATLDEELDGDLAAGVLVEAELHLTKSTFTQLSNDKVVTNLVMVRHLAHDTGDVILVDNLLCGECANHLFVVLHLRRVCC